MKAQSDNSIKWSQSCKVLNFIDKVLSYVKGSSINLFKRHIGPRYTDTILEVSAVRLMHYFLVSENPT